MYFTPLKNFGDKQISGENIGQLKSLAQFNLICQNVAENWILDIKTN